MDRYDYVIAGGGAAGCVLAARLSEDPGIKVLLLEAGPDVVPGREPADILDAYPSSYYNRSYFWPGLKAHWRRRDNSIATSLPQGRVLGGGGSVMGMIALRGTPHDYDGWEAQGARGWGWDGVLPYFCKLESDQDYGGDLHGRGGPMPVHRTPQRQWPPLTRGISAYAEAHGIPYVADMNADFRDGYGSLPMSNTGQRRASSALQYLDAAARARPNLTVQADAHVTRVLFSGKTAVGVEALVGGEKRAFNARETIVAGGGVFSPAILLRSGVGPAAQLQALGLKVVHDLPGVGRNLQNHALLFIGFHLKKDARQGDDPRPHHTIAFRYSSGLPGGEPADLFINIASKTSWSALGRQIGAVSPYLLRPQSRGWVELASPDPLQAPRVEFNFLDTESDVQRLMAGFTRAVEVLYFDRVRPLMGMPFPVRFADTLRKLNDLNRPNAAKSAAIAASLDLLPGLSDLVLGTLTGERVDLRELVGRPADLAAHVREHCAGPFHLAGSCRMGPAGDAGAVVDTEGRVHGVEGLRVADASIMPAVVRGNTNIPTIMVAEKIAAAISA